MELAAQQSRLKELELRLLLQAERDDIGADSGAVSAPAWLAHATRTTIAGRHRDLHLATALDGQFGATREAFAAGIIDVEKAGIITAAVESLTAEYDDLPAGTEERAEAHLIDQAQRFDAPTLRRLAKRLFEVVCPEAADAAEGRTLEQEEARARTLAHFSVHDNGDGTSDGRFRLPTLHAQLLKKALEALTSPRRIGEGRLDPQTGRKLPHSTLLGQGLMDLLENHLSDLPSVNGSPFTLVVTIGIDALMSGLGPAALDTGTADLGRGGEAAGLQGRDHPDGPRRRLGATGPRPKTTTLQPLPENRDQPPLPRLRRRQLRQTTRLDGVPPRTALAPNRQDRREQRDLPVPAAPPPGRPPRHLRHATTAQRQSPLLPAHVRGSPDDLRARP